MRILFGFPFYNFQKVQILTGILLVFADSFHNVGCSYCTLESSNLVLHLKSQSVVTQRLQFHSGTLLILDVMQFAHSLSFFPALFWSCLCRSGRELKGVKIEEIIIML